MIVTISTKGQVIIPKAIRDELKLKENSPLSMEVVHGKIIVMPINEEKIRQELEEFWEFRRKAPKMTMKEIDQLVKDTRAKRRAEGRSRH